MKPTQAQVCEIINIAEANPTEEVCGYIVSDRVVQCENLAERRDRSFQLRAPDEVSCIWHSHIDGSTDFSVSDIKASKELEVPYFVYCVGAGLTHYFDPKHTAPFIGREFHWSWMNCYTLFQDYYRQELGVELPDFYLSAPTSFRYQSVGYLEELPKHGFRMVDRFEAIQRHDVVLAYEGMRIANHVAIVIDPASGTVLHHLANQLSGFALYDLSPKSKNIHSIWRHRQNENH